MDGYVLIESRPSSARILNCENVYIGVTPLFLERSKYINRHVSIIFGTEVKQKTIEAYSERILIEFKGHVNTNLPPQNERKSQRPIFLICNGIFFLVLIYFVVRLDLSPRNSYKSIVKNPIEQTIVNGEFPITEAPDPSLKEDTEEIADMQYDNFTLFNIEGVGSIFIPNTMELQEGSYKKMNDGFTELMEKKFDLDISDNRIVFQQKGLNDVGDTAIGDYARIIIDTEKQPYTEYLPSLEGLTETAKEEIGSEAKYYIQKEFDKVGVKLLQWNGVEVVKLGDTEALSFSYLRQFNDNPVVEVSIFRFWNNDKLIRITVSYRKRNKDRWSPEMASALESLKIDSQIK